MVDLIRSEAQVMLQRGVREFLEHEVTRERRDAADASLEGFDRGLWQQMADLDWLRLPFGKPYGAGESGPEETAILAEELGRVAMSTPFVPTIVAGLLFQDCGRPALLDRLVGITN